MSPLVDKLETHSVLRSVSCTCARQDAVTWVAGVTVGGHFEAVEDLDWGPEGRYLLSVSGDQTTRLHGYWSAGKEEEVSLCNVVCCSTFCLNITHLSEFVTHFVFQHFGVSEKARAHTHTHTAHTHTHRLLFCRARGMSWRGRRSTDTT